MKLKPSTSGKIDRGPKKGSKGKKDDKPKIKWFAKLNIKKIVDSLPIMTHTKGLKERIQLPIHSSSEIIATMIREKHPGLFKINLDVHRSMHYAGRQLFEHVYLNAMDIQKASKQFRLAKMMDDVESFSYDASWLESYLSKMMESYLSHGHGRFSRNSIVKQIETLKLELPEELHARCDNFIDDDLDSAQVKNRIQERLRKRDYRERKKKISLVK